MPLPSPRVGKKQTRSRCRLILSQPPFAVLERPHRQERTNARPSPLQRPGRRRAKSRQGPEVRPRQSQPPFFSLTENLHSKLFGEKETRSCSKPSKPYQFLDLQCQECRKEKTPNLGSLHPSNTALWGSDSPRQECFGTSPSTRPHEHRPLLADRECLVGRLVLKCFDKIQTTWCRWSYWYDVYVNTVLLVQDFGRLRFPIHPTNKSFKSYAQVWIPHVVGKMRPIMKYQNEFSHTEITGITSIR